MCECVEYILINFSLLCFVLRNNKYLVMVVKSQLSGVECKRVDLQVLIPESEVEAFTF